MGKTFANLTNTSVNGQQYSNPAEAAIVAAQQTKAPTYTAQIDSSIPQVTGYTQSRPIQPGQPEFQSAPAPANVTYQPSGGSAPTISHPDFRTAAIDEAGNIHPMSNQLTTKGKLLGFLLNAAQGVGDGIAAGALNARPGVSAFGVGLRGAMEGADQRTALFQHQRAQDAEDQLRQQSLAQGPVLFQSKLDSERANAEKDRAAAKLYGDKGSINNYRYIPGIGEVYLPDTPGTTPQTVVAAPEKGPTIKGTPNTGIVSIDGNGNVTTLVKTPPKAGKTGKLDLKGEGTALAAQALNEHGGDVNAALADFQQRLPGAIARNPHAQAVAPYVVAAIKAGAQKHKSASTINVPKQ